MRKYILHRQQICLSLFWNHISIATKHPQETTNFLSLLPAVPSHPCTPGIYILLPLTHWGHWDSAPRFTAEVKSCRKFRILFPTEALSFNPWHTTSLKLNSAFSNCKFCLNRTTSNPLSYLDSREPPDNWRAECKWRLLFFILTWGKQQLRVYIISSDSPRSTVLMLTFIFLSERVRIQYGASRWFMI